ncbi:MAG: hypothetical protein PXX73_03295 [Sideroxydans sp.]|nr:hypothetical protein [Sideroxydans sp.]
MKRLVILAAILTNTTAFADTHVSGHTRSSPDAQRSNNYNSQTNGGHQRDEYSSGTGATNKSNGSYGARDNDRDGVYNPYDSKPESKRGSW